MQNFQFGVPARVGAAVDVLRDTIPEVASRGEGRGATALGDQRAVAPTAAQEILQLNA